MSHVCPRSGPPLALAGRHRRRPHGARAVAPKCEAHPSHPPLPTRRAVSAATLLLAALPFPASSAQLEAEATAEGQGESGVPDGLELERYTDQEQGFTLLKPASWPKVRST